MIPDIDIVGSLARSSSSYCQLGIQQELAEIVKLRIELLNTGEVTELHLTISDSRPLRISDKVTIILSTMATSHCILFPIFNIFPEKRQQFLQL